MFVDVKTIDCDGDKVVLTVNLNNIFFETCWPDSVSMFVVGHKEYYEKQSRTQYSSFENKRYDYPLSWAEYNRLRGLMGLPIAHVRECGRGSGSGNICECSCDGYAAMRTQELESIREKAFKYWEEHPIIFEQNTGEEDGN
jgi:hypothetical protein